MEPDGVEEKSLAQEVDVQESVSKEVTLDDSLYDEFKCYIGPDGEFDAELHNQEVGDENCSKKSNMMVGLATEVQELSCKEMDLAYGDEEAHKREKEAVLPLKKVPARNVYEATRAGDVERLMFFFYAGVDVNVRDACLITKDRDMSWCFEPKVVGTNDRWLLVLGANTMSLEDELARRQWEEKGLGVMWVAFQGCPRAYSEAVAIMAHPGCEGVSRKSYKDVIWAMESCRVDRAILAMESMLKCVGNNSIITIKADDGCDIVTFMFESPNQDNISDFEMKLMDIGTEHLGIPESEYQSIVRMPSQDFALICKDLRTIGDTVIIFVIKEGVNFSTKGDIGSANIVCWQNSSVHEPEEATVIEMQEPVSLTLSLCYMNSFTKATPLSNSITLHQMASVQMSQGVQVEVCNLLMEYVPYYGVYFIQDEKYKLNRENNSESSPDLWSSSQAECPEWAKGHYTEGVELIDLVLDIVRVVLSIVQCDVFWRPLI